MVVKVNSYGRIPKRKSLSVPFSCVECGFRQPRWIGRCPSCGQWNTLLETNGLSEISGAESLEAVPLVEIDLLSAKPISTGLPEFDRALGGGLIPGSVTLLAGEPGIGKSTLTIQVAIEMARSGSNVLLVSGEESAAQIRTRAERLGSCNDKLWYVGDSQLGKLIRHLEQLEPDLLVIDSVQTLYDPDDSGLAGSPNQLRVCTSRLIDEAKNRGISVVLVGHITKDGAVAGPKVLEHAVDTVLDLGGERHHALRVLRVTKHRFGPTDDLGLFEMTERGLVGVEDPGGFFLVDRVTDVPGSAVLPSIEGRRPLLVELQALVVRSTTPHPRRSSQGVDSRRLALLLAVLDRRVGLEMGGLDVYATAVGGAQVTEPGADLPLALAVISSLTGRRLSSDLVACGEVGLGGELRQVAHLERRLFEAKKLGFTRAILPGSGPDGPNGMEIIRVRSLVEAAEVSGLIT